MLKLQSVVRKCLNLSINPISKIQNPKFCAPFAPRFIVYALLLLLIAVSSMPLPDAVAAQVELAWEPSSGPVAGYKIYYGSSSENYDHSVDVGNYTGCTISGLQEGKTYYFAATAYDANDFESDFSEEVSYKIPIVSSEVFVEDTISLPSDDAYGNIKSGDQSHIDEVNYRFGGLAGDVALYYQAWDVDFTDEIQIVLNGTQIGYAPTTGNDSWGGLQAIILPDALVNDSSDNYLTFNNTANPPNTWYWGVRNVSMGEPSRLNR